MPLLGFPWRDIWPHDNPLGDNHTRGPQCPCCPWAYRDGEGKAVIVHGWFMEKIIYAGNNCPATAYAEDVGAGFEWVEVVE